MAGDKPRYELHFHGLVQGTVVTDYNKVTKIFQSSLVRSTSVHQLPLDITDFTGRQDELDHLTALLRQAAQHQETAIAVLTGMAGVGKSTLAIHAAYSLKHQFPDTQLYVNLRGTEGQPLEAFEVLAGFLRTLGVDDQLMPDNLAERAELYRSLLSDKRALVLLDNAHDEVQVRPLLTGSATCAVLVTSRRRLAALEGATILDLAVMTEPAALALLQKSAGGDHIQAESEAAKNIVDLCNRLPLAIRIAGGTLKNQPDWQLNDYFGNLSLERQRLVQLRLSDLDVRTTLALSYQKLDAIAARLYRFLGLLTGASFASGLATALLESEPKIAEESVARLVDVQLLEPIGEGRYRFHDLVRLSARGQLAQEEPSEARQAARLRASRWYLETAEQMNLALNQETRHQLAQVLVKGNDQSLEAIEQKLLLEALNWFESERTNLLASVEWAHQAEAREIVIPLARNLVNFFNTYAYWTDWERTHLLALEATRELGNRIGEAETLTNLGNVYSLRSNWDKASDCYEKGLGIFGELSDRLGVAKTLGNLANVYSRQDDWDKARACYQQSLSIFGELGDRYSEGQTLANLGILHAQQNEQQKAIVLWQESLTRLPSDLPKSKRVSEWLQSIKGLTLTDEKPTEESPAGRRNLYFVGGLLCVIAIALVWLFQIL